MRQLLQQAAWTLPTLAVVGLSLFLFGPRLITRFRTWMDREESHDDE